VDYDYGAWKWKVKIGEAEEELEAVEGRRGRWLNLTRSGLDAKGFQTVQ
jgi:hypothetical protein